MNSSGKSPSVDVGILGARRDYQVPLALQQAGLLRLFFTDFYIGNKPWLQRALRAIPPALKPPAIRRMEARYRRDLRKEKIRSFDVWELRQRREFARAREHHLYFCKKNREFCEHILQSWPADATAVYGANGASLEWFREAKRRDAFCILEQTSSPMRSYNRAAAEVSAAWPGWQAPADQGNCLAEREEAEWRLADLILCPSQHVLESVGLPSCVWLPYAIDTTRFKPPAAKSRSPRVHLLFVGAVRLEKGVPYLLEALRLLDSPAIECRIVGPHFIRSEKLQSYARFAEFTGPVVRDRIQEMYHWADVFVFPSLSEGSASVTYEALASGLPVITTPDSGSVVRDGVDGFIVPARDSSAIAERISSFLMSTALLDDMSRQAPANPNCLSEAQYCHSLVEIIRTRLSAQS